MRRQTDRNGKLRRDTRLLRAEELLTWGRSLDSELSKEGAVSAANRKTAKAMIEAAMNEAAPEVHRGGHRSTARRELMPWEAEREAHTAELVEAALRGRHNRRTPSGSCRVRLEYLRGELQAERISYGELAELQGYGEDGRIPEGDIELREAAGLPEFA